MPFKLGNNNHVFPVSLWETPMIVVTICTRRHYQFVAHFVCELKQMLYLKFSNFASGCHQNFKLVIGGRVSQHALGHHFLICKCQLSSSTSYILSVKGAPSLVYYISLWKHWDLNWKLKISSCICQYNVRL